MTTTTRVLVGLFLSLLLQPVRGDDWPQWLGPQRDAVWRETGILENFLSADRQCVGGAKSVEGTPVLQ